MNWNIMDGSTHPIRKGSFTEHQEIQKNREGFQPDHHRTQHLLWQLDLNLPGAALPLRVLNNSASNTASESSPARPKIGGKPQRRAVLTKVRE